MNSCIVTTTTNEIMKIERGPITCRVCLQCDPMSSTKYLSVFESYNGSSISEKINAIASVEIKQGDGLPDRICPDCLLQLESAVAFKNKCESSNDILYNTTLSSPKCEIEVQVKKEGKLNHNYWIKEEDTDYEIDLVQNTSTEKLKREKNSPVVECNECGETFKSKCKLRMHWRTAHQPDKLTCQICKRMFKSYKAFNVHTKKRPRSCLVAGLCRIEGKGKSRVFYCKDCSYYTKRPKDMESHTVIHTGEKKFQCDKCLKVFSQQSSLQGHKEMVHKIWLVVTTCHYCGKSIKGRHQLYRHLSTHTQASVQCEICKKVLKSKQNLQNHMLRHSGVKKYACEVCAQTFYTVAELCTHRRKVHMKSKNYKCDICGYTVYNSATLKIHKSKHTGINMPCLICGVFAENSEMLAVHQKRHFERNTQCLHCDKMFFNKKSRNKHIYAKHRARLSMNMDIKNMTVNMSGIKQESTGENQYHDNANACTVVSQS